MNIINTATAWKTYHTTYFNHLKQWINRTEEKADILAIHYGGELLLLAFKRVFAKKNENTDEYN